MEMKLGITNLLELGELPAKCSRIHVARGSAPFEEGRRTLSMMHWKEREQIACAYAACAASDVLFYWSRTYVSRVPDETPLAIWPQ